MLSLKKCQKIFFLGGAPHLLLNHSVTLVATVMLRLSSAILEIFDEMVEALNEISGGSSTAEVYLVLRNVQDFTFLLHVLYVESANGNNHLVMVLYPKL